MTAPTNFFVRNVCFIPLLAATMPIWNFLSFSTVDENFEVPFVGFCGHAGHLKKYLLFSSREAVILPPSDSEQAKVSA